MSDSTPKSYSSDPVLYLYTSLTSGSSHIVTATSRLETILKANRVPFRALDIATDEKARMLWGRRSGKDESGRARKIPGLVQMGLVIGDLVEIEDWNEYGELKQHVKIVPIDGTPVKSAVPTPSSTPSKAPKSENTKSTPAPETPESKPPVGATPTSFTLAMRQAGEEAAQKAKDAKKKGMEVLTGKGEAAAAPVDPKPSASTTKASASPPKEAPSSTKETTHSIPPPIHLHKTLASSSSISSTATATSMQSPTSTAWKTTGRPSKESVMSYHHPFMEAMQSPNSTAWKSTDVDPPITMHRGSSISLASAEEIRDVERSQTIKEEDEGEDEEDEDENDQEDEDDEDDEDENDEAEDKKENAVKV